MTSEGLGEMFEGDSADTCAGKFPLTSMGAERRVSRAQTRERKFKSEFSDNTARICSLLKGGAVIC